MTISIVLVIGKRRKLLLTSQWQFLNSLLKMSLTSQWQFWKGRHHVGMCTFTKMSLTCQWHFFLLWEWVTTENCHWPVNDNFFCYGNGLPQKIVIDWSMTALMQLSKNVIDWSITIFASIRNGLSQKIVIDWSMTIFWQPWSHWELLKAENHSTLWTYHLWPYVIDHSQWQKLMDKAQKSVIDNGQWQKNCHWPWSMTKKIVIDWKVST